MALIKVWLHIVWGTKSHKPFLKKEIKQRVLDHIKENARAKGIYINCINGYVNHLHCLVGLNADMSIAKTVQLIKGESAFWINKNGITSEKFEWADEYYAGSISESHLGKVKEYIHNQEEHHRKMTFEEEYRNFIEEYNSKHQG